MSRSYVDRSTLWPLPTTEATCWMTSSRLTSLLLRMLTRMANWGIDQYIIVYPQSRVSMRMLDHVRCINSLSSQYFPAHGNAGPAPPQPHPSTRYPQPSRWPTTASISSRSGNADAQRHLRYPGRSCARTKQARRARVF